MKFLSFLAGRNRRFAGWRRAAAAFLLAGASLCIAGGSCRAQDLIYGVGGNDSGSGPDASRLTLFSFLSNAPAVTTTIGTVTTTSNYVLESIAMQPVTGVLYGLEYNGAQGQLVSIDRTNASLRTIGNAFALGSIAGNRGNSAAIAFNRQTGMLQLVTGAGYNYTVNPTTGALGTNGNLAYASGDVNSGSTFQISSLAFTGNTLYDIDYAHNYLATQSVTVGTLSSVGSNGLGLIASQNAGSEGFTYPQRGALGYLSASTSTSGVLQDRFFTVNLTTGVASNIGAIGTSTTFNTVSIATAPDAAAAAAIPEPGTSILCMAGVLALGTGFWRRRRI